MFYLPNSTTTAVRLCGALCSILLLLGCTTALTPLPTPVPTYAHETDPAQSNTETDAWTTPAISVIAEGLLGPIGLEALPDGSLLVAEEGTGGRDDSAGVSLITPDGRVGRFVSGLPSSRDSGDLAGVPLVRLAPDGQTLHIGNFGQGHLWTLELSDEELAGGFELPATPYMPEQLGKAMLPLNNVMLINPFDMTYAPDGRRIVSDASGNGLATENPDGTTRFFHRFEEIEADIGESSTRAIEAVPTGIIRVGDEYWVTLLGGCPYPAAGGRLVAVDEARNQRTLLDGLNMPIDVAQGPDGTIWVLEFATFPPGGNCFSGADYQVETGRLSRLTDDGELVTVIDNLNFPGAVLPMPDGSLYISEVLPGRVLHVTFEESQRRPPALEPTTQVAPKTAKRQSVADLDLALAAVIEGHQLEPYPGAEQREESSPASDLGQLLFFDPLLSGDQNISCATCHHPVLAMADGRALPIGTGGHGLGPTREFLERVALSAEADAVRRLAAMQDEENEDVLNPFRGQFVPRNSPTILNSALMTAQFWDGRVENYSAVDAFDSTATQAATVKTQERAVNDMALTDPLATQALFPVASLHEMAGATFGGLPPQTIRQRLLERLRANPEYVDLFRHAFGSKEEGSEEAVTLTRLVAALAAFERRFIYTDAPWDRYLAGQTDALNRAEKRGALLFFGAVDPAVNCASCHSGNLFTDQDYHNLLVPQLGPGKEHGYSGREDWGRAGVTHDARDRYAFRTPSLRNAELTAPYFHTGAYPKLEAAIHHHADIMGSATRYDPGSAAIPPDLYSSYQPVDLSRQLVTTPTELRAGLPLTAGDVRDLAAFMRALTDPDARNLMHFVPERVPSGLPLDPLPDMPDTSRARHAATAPVPPASQAHAAQPMTDEVALPAAAFSFADVAAEVGLEFLHGAFAHAISDDPAAAMGGGLCWLDYDRDGWLDLYLVNSHAEDEATRWQGEATLPSNKLYRNARGTFQDVSAASGTALALRGMGCVAADFNHDGWTDLYLTADGPNALLWNNGDGTFSEGAAVAGVDATEWNSAAAVGDLNGDGWVDLFVTAYIDLNKRIPKPSGAFPQDYYGLPDRLYLNRGDGTFEEASTQVGLMYEERSLGALLSDLDQDGDLDLYIANDGHPNRLYRNDATSGDADFGLHFTDITAEAGVGDSGSGMGVAGGDYDRDGWTDLFVTNWERELNALYRSEMGETADLIYRYSTFRIGISGLGNGMTGWGTHLSDFDHDTDADLLIVNGRVPVTNLATDPELVRFYRNRTADRWDEYARTGHFLDWTGQVGLKEIGPLLGRGSAVADYDNDGDLDVAINQIAGPAVLLRNDLVDQETSENANWLIIDPGSVTPGLRARVTLPNGETLVREVFAGSSYLAGEDPRLHFGLGAATRVANVEVIWPDEVRMNLEDVGVNQVIGLE